MCSQELAKKIKGYQEQIASLNSKCKMLTMKAKHATMLLTVTEVEGLTEGMEELDAELLPAHSAHPSVVMVRPMLALSASMRISKTENKAAASLLSCAPDGRGCFATQPHLPIIY